MINRNMENQYNIRKQICQRCGLECNVRRPSKLNEQKLCSVCWNRECNRLTADPTDYSHEKLDLPDFPGAGE